MTVVYTSRSGANDDALEHPTVQGSRFVLLRVLDTDDIVTAPPLDPSNLTDYLSSLTPGTPLAPGAYATELLQWDGAEWGPAGADVELTIPGDFQLSAAGAGSLVIQPLLTTLLGTTLQLNDATAANTLRMTNATWDGFGVTVTLASDSGAGLTFGAAGAELGVAAGDTFGIGVNGDDRFRAFDDSAQMSAASASGSYFLADETGIEVHAGETLHFVLVVDEQTLIEGNDTGLGFFGGAPTGRGSITGATIQQQIDSIVSALVALNLVTDDR